MVPRLTVALLLLLAGCTTAGGGGTPAGTDVTHTPVPTASATPSHDTPTDATEANTIAYADLSPAERRAFDAAVADGAEFFEESRHVEGDYLDPAVADVFERHEYIRKDGSYYRLSVQFGALYASYGIRTTEGQPSGTDTVVAYENLSARTREPVRWAIENGSYTTPLGKWSSLPDDLDGVEYVRYSGTHYRLSVVVGDAWVQVWTAEEVG